MPQTNRWVAESQATLSVALGTSGPITVPAPYAIRVRWSLTRPDHQMADPSFRSWHLAHIVDRNSKYRLSNILRTFVWRLCVHVCCVPAHARLTRRDIAHVHHQSRITACSSERPAPQLLVRVTVWLHRGLAGIQAALNRGMPEECLIQGQWLMERATSAASR